jgi:hypothetical protein
MFSKQKNRKKLYPKGYKAKPTLYKNILMRSRLEARQCMFKDLLGIQYQYEPANTFDWYPDTYLFDFKCLEEIKPIGEFDKEMADRMIESTHNERDLLLTGLSPLIPNCYEPILGWAHKAGNDTDDWRPVPSSLWGDLGELEFLWAQCCNFHNWYGNKKVDLQIGSDKMTLTVYLTDRDKP